ncbi:MAG TPA: hypothetical protein DCR14_07590 [Acidimicrobiaceae bacterium]|nr:hypothetical protein [Acidimicrobiaceae bacterium]
MSHDEARFPTRCAAALQISQAVPVDIVWTVLFVGVLVGMWYLGYRIDPHWSSKDGRRFMCNSQIISLDEPVGRMREVQVVVLDDGTLAIAGRRGARRRYRSTWVLIAKTDDLPKKTHVYLARLIKDGVLHVDQMALRLPMKSRCIPVLDDALARRSNR